MNSPSIVVFLILFGFANGEISLNETLKECIGAPRSLNNYRVFGGENTTEGHTYEYQVSIQYLGEHICSGIIYEFDVVLTASICLENVTDYSNLTFVAGTRTTTPPYPDHAQIGYYKEGRCFIDKYYFCKLKLTDEFYLSDYVIRAKIEYFNYHPEMPAPANSTCFVGGWGQTEEGSGNYSHWLKAIHVQIMDNKECHRQLAFLENEDESKFKEVICTVDPVDNKGLCQGDLGSPLWCYDSDNIVGVFAFGYGCGRKNCPSVYIRTPARPGRPGDELSYFMPTDDI